MTTIDREVTSRRSLQFNRPVVKIIETSSSEQELRPTLRAGDVVHYYSPA